PMQPYLSAPLRETLSYWTAAYREQGLRNVTAETRILGIEPARLTQDAFFDAFTVRVSAEGLDWTEDAGGTIVGGSRSARRRYTEYWTLLRGAARAGAGAVPACPACGAPLDINQQGACTHCGAL